MTAGTEVSDRDHKYSWDLKTRTRSRSPSFSSFKRSDSLSSFECIGEEAIAIATTATITRCKANTSIRIIDKPPLRKVKSDLWFDIQPIPPPGPTPEGRPKPIYQDRLKSWEQARPRDGLCPIGPFAPHPAHTCHYMHHPVAVGVAQ
ncbi:hypothetical protein Slin15195_G060350 [Septoria linicola]|uniref:Uncharacterized protein n=1 Tax=Septoria linicola TaxID=215465 RepID=A0A9Q9AVS0_9PEZI|nr:hypothetical protein Slin15195_G060350 [Septoria linicola]